MAPTYTTLSDVQTVLNTSDKEVVRFSDSVTKVELKDSNNSWNQDIVFDYDSITVDSSFQEKLRLIIEFTNSTTFDVYKKTSKVTKDVLQDSGQSISSNYTTPDGNITIPSGAWGGTIEAGDKVDIKFDPHMSKDQAEKIIEWTEIQIDGMLSEHPVDTLEDGETRHFDPNASPARPVPQLIEVATTYLSAYYIYTDTFATVYEEGSTPDSTYAGRWKNKAEKMVKMYINTAGWSPPVAVTFPKHIQRIGIYSEDEDLPTPMGITSDSDDDLRDSYGDKVFWKEQVPEGETQSDGTD